ncbi:T9SS type A sorting domain-containing protein [Segetibacter sp. 3557_3]|uniref:T9SS type A sorting domain-containing protein n=1 Tax=Segetibacter sp. 3557_3 TaxID=2547429 RepID=UPI0010588975|nr:T9SS type A sorting domain-containing protein [Segetibacter sp. 3557_3]TDH23434.1 T9SS type A sorting domain-containing protein [Segetibacter sp. 3557_3]
MKFRILLLTLAFASVATRGRAQTWQLLGSNEQTNQALTRTAAPVTYTAIDANGTPYISYLDDMQGPANANDFKVHVKKWVNNQWTDLGGVSTEIPYTDYFPIACDGNNLYLAYSESAVSSTGAGKITVKKYNTTNNNWEYVGSPAFSAGTASYTGITAANGKVYVAYTDAGTQNKVVVKYFDNSSPNLGWRTLGSAPISLGTVGGLAGNNINLSVDNDELYVAYIDFGVNNGNGGLMVKRFTNDTWITAGNGLASGSERATNARLRFDGNHNLYVSYIEPVSMQLKVRLLINNVWADFTNNVVATNVRHNSSFTILNNTLYVAYVFANSGEQGQAYVKKFDNTNLTWENVGAQPVTASTIEVNDVNLTATPAGMLHLNFHTFNNAVYAKSFNVGGALPVTWKSFTAERINDKAVLKWKVANEVNNKLFVVEHSRTGQSFSKVGEVAANAGNAAERHYTFTSSGLDEGVHYYRLKQVDKDGAFSYSPIVNVSISSPTTTTIRLYPNPVTETLIVSGNLTTNAPVVITTADGKVVKKAIITSEQPRLNVNELAQGRYYLTIYGSGAPQTLPFVK